MSLDLKINFDDLDGVLQSIKRYRSALATISGASERFLEALQRQESKAYEALSQVWIEKVQGDEQELDNRLAILEDLLQCYINTMWDHMAPVDSSKMMRVDQGDIYYNMMQIELATDSIQDICWDTGSSHVDYRTYIDPESQGADWARAYQEAEYWRRVNNYSKLKSFRDDIAGAFRDEMKEYVRQMWAIYTDHIEPFEAADDKFGCEAGSYYWEWANARDHFENAKRAIADVGRGAKEQISEIWDGMITLGVASNPEIQSKRLVGQGDAETNIRIEGFNQGVTRMVKDPIGTSEAVVQSVSDKIEEEGLAYGLGYLGTDVAIGLATKKVMGVSQVTDDMTDVLKYSNFTSGMSPEDAARYIAYMDKEFLEEFAERARLAGLNETQIMEAYNAMRAQDYVKIASYFDTTSPVDGAVFWSGNKDGAARYANNIGGTIMEQTRAGQIFDDWRGLQCMYPEWDTKTALAQKPIWNALSAQYATGAKGEVTYVMQEGYSNPNSLWKTIEYPILEDLMDDGIVTDISTVIIKE